MKTATNLLVELIATAAEMGRVARVLPGIERSRQREGTLAAVTRARSWPGKLRRSGLGRQRLCRAIGWLDAWMLGGPNCYRRALLEMAVDREAAGRPLALGFRVDSEKLSGHAWIAGSEPAADYDFTIQV